MENNGERRPLWNGFMSLAMSEATNEEYTAEATRGIEPRPGPLPRWVEQAWMSGKECAEDQALPVKILRAANTKRQHDGSAGQPGVANEPKKRQNPQVQRAGRGGHVPVKNGKNQPVAPVAAPPPAANNYQTDRGRGHHNHRGRWNAPRGGGNRRGIPWVHGPLTHNQRDPQAAAAPPRTAFTFRLPGPGDDEAEAPQ